MSCSTFSQYWRQLYMLATCLSSKYFRYSPYVFSNCEKKQEWKRLQCTVPTLCFGILKKSNSHPFDQFIFLFAISQIAIHHITAQIHVECEGGWTVALWSLSQSHNCLQSKTWTFYRQGKLYASKPIDWLIVRKKSHVRVTDRLIEVNTAGNEILQRKSTFLMLLLKNIHIQSGKRSNSLTESF